MFVPCNDRSYLAARIPLELSCCKCSVYGSLMYTTLPSITPKYLRLTTEHEIVGAWLFNVTHLASESPALPSHGRDHQRICFKVQLEICDHVSGYVYYRTIGLPTRLRNCVQSRRGSATNHCSMRTEGSDMNTFLAALTVLL
jgi:hypothetical protein